MSFFGASFGGGQQRKRVDLSGGSQSLNRAKLLEKTRREREERSIQYLRESSALSIQRVFRSWRSRQHSKSAIRNEWNTHMKEYMSTAQFTLTPTQLQTLNAQELQVLLTTPTKKCLLFMRCIRELLYFFNPLVDIKDMDRLKLLLMMVKQNVSFGVETTASNQPASTSLNYNDNVLCLFRVRNTDADSVAWSESQWSVWLTVTALLRLCAVLVGCVYGSHGYVVVNDAVSSQCNELSPSSMHTDIDTNTRHTRPHTLLRALRSWSSLSSIPHMHDRVGVCAEVLRLLLMSVVYIPNTHIRSHTNTHIPTPRGECTDLTDKDRVVSLLLYSLSVPLLQSLSCPWTFSDAADDTHMTDESSGSGVGRGLSVCKQSVFQRTSHTLMHLVHTHARPHAEPSLLFFDVSQIASNLTPALQRRLGVDRRVSTRSPLSLPHSTLSSLSALALLSHTVCMCTPLSSTSQLSTALLSLSSTHTSQTPALTAKVATLVLSVLFQYGHVKVDQHTHTLHHTQLLWRTWLDQQLMLGFVSHVLTIPFLWRRCVALTGSAQPFIQLNHDTQQTVETDGWTTVLSTITALSRHSNTLDTSMTATTHIIDMPLSSASVVDSVTLDRMKTHFEMSPERRVSMLASQCGWTYTDFDCVLVSLVAASLVDTISQTHSQLSDVARVLMQLTTQCVQPAVVHLTHNLTDAMNVHTHTHNTHSHSHSRVTELFKTSALSHSRSRSWLDCIGVLLAMNSGVVCALTHTQSHLTAHKTPLTHTHTVEEEDEYYDCDDHDSMHVDMNTVTDTDTDKVDLSMASVRALSPSMLTLPSTMRLLSVNIQPTFDGYNYSHYYNNNNHPYTDRLVLPQWNEDGERERSHNERREREDRAVLELNVGRERVCGGFFRHDRREYEYTHTHTFNTHKNTIPTRDVTMNRSSDVLLWDVRVGSHTHSHSNTTLLSSMSLSSWLPLHAHQSVQDPASVEFVQFYRSILNTVTAPTPTSTASRALKPTVHTLVSKRIGDRSSYGTWHPWLSVGLRSMCGSLYTECIRTVTDAVDHAVHHSSGRPAGLKQTDSDESAQAIHLSTVMSLLCLLSPATHNTQRNTGNATHTQLILLAAAVNTRLVPSLWEFIRNHPYTRSFVLDGYVTVTQVAATHLTHTRTHASVFIYHQVLCLFGSLYLTLFNTLNQRGVPVSQHPLNPRELCLLTKLCQVTLFKYYCRSNLDLLDDVTGIHSCVSNDPLKTVLLSPSTSMSSSSSVSSVRDRVFLSSLPPFLSLLSSSLSDLYLALRLLHSQSPLPLFIPPHAQHLHATSTASSMFCTGVVTFAEFAVLRWGEIFGPQLQQQQPSDELGGDAFVWESGVECVRLSPDDYHFYRSKTETNESDEQESMLPSALTSPPRTPSDNTGTIDLRRGDVWSAMRQAHGMLWEWPIDHHVLFKYYMQRQSEQHDRILVDFQRQQEALQDGDVVVDGRLGYIQCNTFRHTQQQQQQQQQQLRTSGVVDDDGEDTVQLDSASHDISYSFLLSLFPFIVPFPRRLALLRQLLRNRQQQQTHIRHSRGEGARVRIRRAHTANDVVRAVLSIGDHVRGRIMVEWVNRQGMVEAGIDGGGLWRELVTEFWKSISTENTPTPGNNTPYWSVDGKGRIIPTPRLALSAPPTILHLVRYIDVINTLQQQQQQQQVSQQGRLLQSMPNYYSTLARCVPRLTQRRGSSNTTTSSTVDMLGGSLFNTTRQYLPSHAPKPSRPNNPPAHDGGGGGGVGEGEHDATVTLMGSFAHGLFSPNDQEQQDGREKDVWLHGVYSNPSLRHLQVMYVCGVVAAKAIADDTPLPFLISPAFLQTVGTYGVCECVGVCVCVCADNDYRLLGDVDEGGMKMVKYLDQLYYKHIYNPQHTDKKEWDELCVSMCVSADLRPDEKRELTDNGYLSNTPLNLSDTTHNTHNAKQLRNVTSSDREMVVVDLVPDGHHVPVSSHNYTQYVSLYTKHTLVHSMLLSSLAFKRGLSMILEKEWLSLFSLDELSLIMCGEGFIDVGDLKAHTVYQHTHAQSDVLTQWFWEIVESFTQQELQLLLLFTTGCSQAPVQGFSSMTPPFTVTFVVQQDLLPTAATCFNMLRLSRFKTKQAMKSKILYAINSNAGFDMG